MSYGTLNLTESSPPQTFTEPVTLETMKAFLGLPERSPADEAEDLEIEGYIAAAREVAEIAQGRDLVRKQLDLSLDYWPSHAIALRAPLVSVDLFQRKDSAGTVTDLVEDTDYIYDTAKHPGLVMPAYGRSWPSFSPWPSSAITIRFTSGYAAESVFWASGTGKRIKQGMQLLVSMWVNNKLPFEPQAMPIQEYPYAVTALLGLGRLERVR